MTTNYAKHVSSRVTPQTEPIPGKPQVANSAGGFSFAVDCWTRLDRFLILGNSGGSYYASEKKLTQENAAAVLECAGIDIVRTVKTIIDISYQGRAPKNDPAIFALALLSKHKAALDAMPQVCRTSTHLFQFVAAAKHFRGWGRALKQAVRKWYLLKSPREISYQLVKYQSRDGWSHRDLLRLSKPRVEGENPLSRAFRWAVGKSDVVPGIDGDLAPIAAFEAAKKATNKREIVNLIEQCDLVRECIPTQFLNEPEVWEALLRKMPYTAMIRNLAKMTAIGLLNPMSQATMQVVNMLGDSAAMKKARIHPLSILVAQKIYAQGRGDKGSLTWSPEPKIIDALDQAFYKAFDAVEPTGKRWFLGIDVSASMSATIAGSPLSCCEAATALAMVAISIEPWTFAGRFNNGIEQCPFSKRMRMDDALRYTRSINGGGTDCSLPMVIAMQQKMPVDVFAVYTDSETWAGRIHPCQALQQYRQKMGIPAKLIVIGMVSSGFTIADPSDGGMMDVVGFDTAVPQVMADFATH